MKTILKLTTVIAFMLSTVVSLAREPKLNLRVNSEAKSLVLTSENGASDMNIQLIDEDKNVIYSENVNQSTFSKKFDLSNLEDGTYYFNTEDGLKSYVYTISLKANTASILKREESYKPFFNRKEGRIYMNFLNLDKSKVEIKVYDKDSRLLFSETIIDKMIVEKAFNFKDAYEGSYTIVLNDNEERYTEEFVVN